MFGFGKKKEEPKLDVAKSKYVGGPVVITIGNVKVETRIRRLKMRIAQHERHIEKCKSNTDNPKAVSNMKAAKIVLKDLEFELDCIYKQVQLQKDMEAAR